MRSQPRQTSRSRVLEGVLRCDNAACQTSYPIVDGIPILVSDPAQLLCNQPAGLLLSLRPETLALLVQGASDDAPVAAGAGAPVDLPGCALG